MVADPTTINPLSFTIPKLFIKHLAPDIGHWHTNTESHTHIFVNLSPRYIAAIHLCRLTAQQAWSNEQLSLFAGRRLLSEERGQHGGDRPTDGRGSGGMGRRTTGMRLCVPPRLLGERGLGRLRVGRPSEPGPAGGFVLWVPHVRRILFPFPKKGVPYLFFADPRTVFGGGWGSKLRGAKTT